MASKSAKAIHYAKLRKVRRRTWLISPDGFRELRHACLLSRKAAADYLGVCVRTVRHWDAGRNRVPWSVVRLLRLRRGGELGGLLDGWEGWTIWRDRLVSPDGRVFLERDMRHLWLTLTQADLFRKSYERSSPLLPKVADRPDACAAVLLISSPIRSPDLLPDSLVVTAPAHPAEPAFSASLLAVAEGRPPASPIFSKSPMPGGAFAVAPVGQTCGVGDEMAQLPGVVPASGCTLPRDVSLISDCCYESPQTQAQHYVAVQPLHALAHAQGPDSNTGLASPSGFRR